MGIAIVSAGIRFPRARTLQEFWGHIVMQRDLSGHASPGRWPLDARELQDAARDGRDAIAHDRVYEIKNWRETQLEEEFPNVHLRELDPLFHLSLGAGIDAWKQCQSSGLDRRRCAVILGNIALPTEASMERAYQWLRESLGDSNRQLQESSRAAENNVPAALPAKVLARALGFGGESFTLDAACASSLYALKIACDELLTKRLDFVLAGGVSRPASLYTQVGFTALQALSKSGRCYPFDDRADGLMVGEGAGIFALKRLDDALAHGDRILGVIRAVGLSNDRDGRLMAPSQEGQLRAMRAAYAEAGWSPDSVDLIECHATGTPLGDATEFKSLVDLWDGSHPEKRAVIGSVKANVGHMLTAAGAAGIAKLLMALQDATLPPTVNFERSPASWQIETSPFRVLKTPEAWSLPEGRARRAAISGFGFGGINAHLLLEQFDADRQIPVEVEKNQPEEDIVLVAATHLYALKDKGVQIESIDGQSTVQSFDLAMRDFRIPPAELQEILPQQLLALILANAIRPKNWPSEILEKVACFVGLELDPMTNLYACRWLLEGDRPRSHRHEAFRSWQDELIPALNANRVIGSLGSIVASRIAREWRFGGPTFTLSSLSESGDDALRLAFRMLRSRQISAAFVLAVDASGSHRGRAQRREFGEREQEDTLGDSAWGVCLMRRSQALDLELPILASVYSAPSVDGEQDDRNDWKRSAARGPAQSLVNTLETFRKLRPQERVAVLQRSEAGETLFFQKDAALSQVETTSQASTQDSPRVQIRRRDLELGSWCHGLKQPAKSEEQTANPMIEAKTSELPQLPIEIRTTPLQQSCLEALLQSEKEQIRSHEAFLQYRLEGDRLLGEILQEYMQSPAPGSARDHTRAEPMVSHQQQLFRWVKEPLSREVPLYDYKACQEFARGKIGNVFGADFAAIDSFPKRVRLPDERLLLCHRVMSIIGEQCSLGSGRMITEHDVFDNAWYLEQDQMPTAIAVESGQADLMLSAYLGADFKTEGRAVYRLLDARVSFHRGLPRVGEIIRYDIQIKRFFEQGGTLFFHFAFEASINGEPLMSMVDGCAGFFSEEALAAGRGIKRSALQEQVRAGRVTGHYQSFQTFENCTLDEGQVEALRRGGYEEAFGSSFAGLDIAQPKTLPGGDMRLVHRINSMQDKGGRFGLGRILAEADIQPDDWFLTCHFVDDQVMPGTLMYECCLHTLRVLLMRKGWVGEAQDLRFEPIPGIFSQLKCRGQVLANTKKVRYDIEIKEIGYQPEPYVICDALMSADDKDIVDITDMSLRLTGLSQQYFTDLWTKQQKASTTNVKQNVAPAYTYEHILAFSNGNPSDCFGPVYSAFDKERRIARLPRPPFQFLDRIEWIEGPLMQQNVGTELLASYDLPIDAWFWEAEGGESLSLAVLVEIALQPCGFMAAYMGSALLSEKDLAFRNLSGSARLHGQVQRNSVGLQIAVRSTQIHQTRDMIIQDYTFRVTQGDELKYDGKTSFGFFTQAALAKQVGLRSMASWSEDTEISFAAYPQGQALPHAPILMVDAFGEHPAPAGRYQKGVLFGKKIIDPKEWFFEAHFYQDPVMPGSLGLQALEQVLKAKAQAIWPEIEVWGLTKAADHHWTYRGQVVPTADELHFELQLKDLDPENKKLTADAVLYCDGLPIYSLDDLSLSPIR